ncbi:MAG: UpxY family transcription antiterminator [Saprospiraceae bacterium]
MKFKETPISTVINDISETESKWFAIYTKYKCEKYVAEQLGKKGIAAYVPLITKIKVYSSRTKRYDIPLINSYVFVNIKKSEYVSVLETEYVMMFLKQRKNLICIPEYEINLLKRVVGEIEGIAVVDISMKQGDEVEIIGGNLTGIKGILLEKEGKNNFIVQLTSIGMQLMMTIDKSNLTILRRSKSA